MSSLQNWLFRPSALFFWLGCLFFSILRYIIFMYIHIFWKLSLCWLLYLHNFFSCSVVYLFILFMVSFPVQKCLNLIRSHLFIFPFVLITLGDRSKKILLWFRSKSVLPSSRSFIVSSLTSRSLIHFEFIFVYGDSVPISFFTFSCPVFPAPIVGESIF